MNSSALSEPRSTARAAPDNRTKREERRAGRLLRWRLPLVFLRVFWLHLTLPQGRQFERVGRCRRRWAGPLNLDWAHWAARVVAGFVGKVPVVRRRPCYWRSLMIFHLLPRFGFPAVLHLGAMPDKSKTTTHLWVSTQGVVLIEGPEETQRYLELAVYTAQPPHD
jgi:hypothetical protein